MGAGQVELDRERSDYSPNAGQIAHVQNQRRVYAGPGGGGGGSRVFPPGAGGGGAAGHPADRPNGVIVEFCDK